MERAAVTQLKASLSEYLRRVKAGEEVLVTERGRPVARLVPVEPGCDPDLLELAKEGILRLGTGRLTVGFWRLPRPSDPGDRVLAALIEEREGSR